MSRFKPWGRINRDLLPFGAWVYYGLLGIGVGAAALGLWILLTGKGG
jgi:hypothetical protein